MKKYLISSVIAGLIVVGCNDMGCSGQDNGIPAGNSANLLDNGTVDILGKVKLRYIDLLPTSQLSKSTYTHNESSFGFKSEGKTMYNVRVLCDGYAQNRDADYTSWLAQKIDGAIGTVGKEDSSKTVLPFTYNTKSICDNTYWCSGEKPKATSTVTSYYIKIDNISATNGSYCAIQMDVRTHDYQPIKKLSADLDWLMTICNNPEYSAQFIALIKFFEPTKQVVTCESGVEDFGLGIASAYSLKQFVYINNLK